MATSEFIGKFHEYKFIFNELYGCGSYLFDGIKYEYCDKMLEKQILLFETCKDKECVLEIGSYMCHSTFIMLLSNPMIKITCIDIDDTYSSPCIKVLNKYFDNRVSFIKANSLDILPHLSSKFDFFHVDGHHENDHIRQEFDYILKLRKPNLTRLTIIFDDQECMKPLQEYINSNFQISKVQIPNCSWNNIYYEIET